MSIIYVQDRHGKPLAPTTRGGHVRRLLDSKQARVVCGNPFAIRLSFRDMPLLPTAGAPSSSGTPMGYPRTTTRTPTALPARFWRTQPLSCRRRCTSCASSGGTTGPISPAWRNAATTCPGQTRKPASPRRSWLPRTGTNASSKRPIAWRNSGQPIPTMWAGCWFRREGQNIRILIACSRELFSRWKPALGGLSGWCSKEAMGGTKMASRYIWSLLAEAISVQTGAGISPEVEVGNLSNSRCTTTKLEEPTEGGTN